METTMDNSHKDVLPSGSALEDPAVRREVLVCDGDRRNLTLAALYPPGTPGGATQPPSDEVPDGKEWLTDPISDAVRTASSLVFDMGGGDRTVQDYVRQELARKNGR